MEVEEEVAEVAEVPVTIAEGQDTCPTTALSAPPLVLLQVVGLLDQVSQSRWHNDQPTIKHSICMSLTLRIVYSS